MELNHLKYFYEVAKKKSFSKAAKSLRISQPSVSKLIKNLENTQGVQLFDRQNKEVLLTPVGQSYFEKAKIIFSHLEELENINELLENELSGTLSIAASDNLCNYLLTKQISLFIERNPKIDIQLFSGTSKEIGEEILEQKYELGFCYTFLNHYSLSLKEVKKVEFKLVCSSELLEKDFQISDLKKINGIGSRLGDYEKKIPVYQFFDQLNFVPQLKIQSNSQEVQKKLVLNGQGYAFLPVHIIAEELNCNKIVSLETDLKFELPLYFVQRKGRTLSPVSTKFLDFLEKNNFLKMS